MLFVGEVFISEPPAAFHVRTTAALLGVNVLTHAIHHMYPYTKARKRRIPSSEMLVQMLLVASAGSYIPAAWCLGAFTCEGGCGEIWLQVGVLGSASEMPLFEIARLTFQKQRGFAHVTLL